MSIAISLKTFCKSQATIYFLGAGRSFCDLSFFFFVSSIISVILEVLALDFFKLVCKRNFHAQKPHLWLDILYLPVAFQKDSFKHTDPSLGKKNRQWKNL